MKLRGRRSFVLALLVLGAWIQASPESPLLPSPPGLGALMLTQHSEVWQVPHVQDELAPTMSRPKAQLDLEQLKRDTRELLDLSQSVRDDIDKVAEGVLPKDTLEKLGRIQKLAKHLHGEIEH